MKQLFAAILVLMLAGCASVQPYNYYRLQAQAPRMDRTVQTSVGLIPVDIPGWLNNARLSWSDGTVQVFRADSDRWGTDLGDEVSRVLTENLSRQLGGVAVSTGPWFGDQRPELVVRVDLENLVMKKAGVEMVARWQLLDKQRTVIVQGEEEVWTADVDQPQNGLRLALGLSQALASMTTEIVAAIDSLHLK